MATGMKRKREDPPSVTPRLVIGIDLGTTFSGVSWLVCQPGSGISSIQPEIVSLWPTSPDNRRKNSDCPKVPTKIHYGKHGEISWGFKIPADAEAIECLGLVLFDDECLPSFFQQSIHIQKAKKLLYKLEKTGIQVIGDYLKMLWDHSLEQIRNEVGSTHVDRMTFEVVLVVPPGRPGDINRIREAAEHAGILNHRTTGETTLTLIPQSRAAALAYMPNSEHRGDLQVGDSFVVLNAGGIIAGVASYKVTKLEPFSISAPCGATSLDQEFEALLKHATGEESWNKMNASDIRKLMNNEWEHEIKGTFSKSDETYVVELPSRANSEAIHLQSIDLQPTFDHIVSQIAKLLHKQILSIKRQTSQPPKLVILVGGFGRSAYLLQYLRGILHSQTSILQARGDKPWTAACRGATLSRVTQLNWARQDIDILQSETARCSYGWTSDEVFDAKVHDMKDRVWNEANREWHAQKQIKWFIRQGEDISQKKTLIFNRWHSWNMQTQGWGTSIIQVLACDDPNPPSRKQGNIRCLGLIHARTPKPVEKLPRVDDGPASYRHWDFKVKVVISRAWLDFFLVSDEKQEEKLLMTLPMGLK
ncbi:hypothetical protein F5B22DRAFT_661773 [Xylaria bambusicola]|uniref:uncharacterized protein n=1 Tax=Xylaria bambusicola TaxID=326684 RepID=UPI0020082BE8|nr:uncharacterized protein F5B22DRAFT_661773 [Xylaria bambusicola]KAI0505211.1 hypothetical protein F5B22DRAFT_661773 [Xylaria bambusicola]